jgi:hypothetical protein
LNLDEIECVLEEAGASFERLSQREGWVIQNSWRDVFRAGSRDAAKLRGHNQLEWQVFTHGGFPALTSNRAMDAYSSQQAEDYYVWVNSADGPLYVCHGGTPPDFSGDDVHVFSRNFEWSMSFTHEQASGLGPYFARGRDA